jgi:hypothetical protein
MLGRVATDGITARLPDFGPIFEVYTADLKAEAEK